MLVAAAVCPHPPLLVPEVAAGAAPELDPLRHACDRAIEALLAVAPEIVYVVGGGRSTRRHDAGSVGSLRPYGVDVSVVLGATVPARSAPTLPLSLTVGAWLLARAEVAAPVAAYEVAAYEVAADADPAECAALGAGLAAERGRVALLVMGDGTARRSERAPGHLDPRAEPYDARAVRALADGDAEALLALDPTTAAELMVAGRSAWQVLAGAVGGDLPDTALLHDAAPYGVEYVVALWERHG